MSIVWKKIDHKVCLGVFTLELNPRIFASLSTYNNLLQEKVSNYFVADSYIFDAPVNYNLSLLCLYLSSRDPDFFRDLGVDYLPEKKYEISFPFLDPFIARWTASAVSNRLVKLVELSQCMPLNRDLVFVEIDKMEAHSKTMLPSFGLEKILQSALLMNIPFSRTAQKFPGYDLGHSDSRTRIWKQFSERTSHIGTVLATNKELTNSLLFSSGIPVPRQVVVSTERQCLDAFAALAKPLVIKPLKTDKGIAVSVGIKERPDVTTAYSNARKYGPVVVEEQVPGEDYRFLVIDNKVIGVTTRRPGVLTGDGKSSVKALFDAYIKQRRQDFFLKYFCNFKLEDVEIIQELEKQGLTADSIPQNGEEVIFRSNPNVSTGGTHEDVTSRVHPDNFSMAVDAAKIIGLDIAGIDFISTDISKSWKEGFGAVCEINPTPALSVESGVQAILNTLNRNEKSLNIPIVVLLRKILEPGTGVEQLKNRFQSIDGVRIVSDDEYTLVAADLKSFTSYPNTSLVVFSLAEQTIRRVGFTEASIDHVLFVEHEFTEKELRNFELLPVTDHTRVTAIDSELQNSEQLNRVLDSIRL